MAGDFPITHHIRSVPGIPFSKKIEASIFISVVILFHGIIFDRLCPMENVMHKKIDGRGTAGKVSFHWHVFGVVSKMGLL